MTLLNGFLPSFDFGEGGLAVALSRGLFIVALFSSYGALLYRARLGGPALKQMPGRSGSLLEKRYDRLAVLSLAAALATAGLWLIAQASALFGSHGASQRIPALGDTLLSTSFGHVLLVQAGLIVAALGCLRLTHKSATLRDIALGCAGLAVVLQVGHDHAASMYDGFSFLLLSEIAHLLAGAAWLGSLLPLLVTVRHAPSSAAHAAAQRFSSFGTVCVIVLAITAMFQGWQLIGSVPGLLGTAYGWMAIAKIALFGALLALAASNRYRLTPRMNRSGGEQAKDGLVRSIAIETAAGFAILMAASLLVTLPPSIHEQPVWPFSWQFSLVTVAESPELFSDVLVALFGMTIALAAVGIGLSYRRFRWPGLALAALIAWFAAPRLSLLFVEAHPTSFYHSTTDFAATSIARGAELYPGHCQSCHGLQGRGDGEMADSLSEPPADLTAPHLWAHADGELFWWLTDGIKSPEGEQVMPAFGTVLSEDERWNLIDYIRANNAGLNYAATGNWSPNIKAPSFQAECKDGAVDSGAFRGRVIRLAFGKTMPATQVAGDVADRLVTVLATPDSVPLADGECLARDPSLAKAYATVTGMKPDDLAGAQFLIDTNGWLRAVQKPGETIAWNDPGTLTEQVVQLCTHPIEQAGSNGAHHHHH